MSDSIKLSPKHGLNTFIPICFWCGQEKSMLCIPGRIDKADSKAPKNMIVDYEPCDKCKELFSHGIHLIGCTKEPRFKNMKPLAIVDNQSWYPTGTHAVVPADFLVEVLLKPNGDEDRLEEITKMGKLILEEDTCLQVVDIIKSFQDADVATGEKEETDNESSTTGVPDDTGTKPGTEN